VTITSDLPSGFVARRLFADLERRASAGLDSVADLPAVEAVTHVSDVRSAVRSEALNALRQAAYTLGANALLGVRFDVVEITDATGQRAVAVTVRGTPCLADRQTTSPAASKEAGEPSLERMVKAAKFLIDEM
jgi:uncharacterized protein YbjQ (UPF0145 family)